MGKSMRETRLMRCWVAAFMFLYDVFWVWMLTGPVYWFDIYPLMTWWTSNSLFWPQMCGLTVCFIFGGGSAVYFFLFGVCLLLDR